MTNRECALAILRYQPYDRLPLVHFGYWDETLEKWVREGHLRPEDVRGYGDGVVNVHKPDAGSNYPNNPAFENKNQRN